MALLAWPLGGLTGCAAIPDERNKPFGFRYVEPSQVAAPSVVMFFVDGVNSDVFAEMLAAGQLPNIEKYFIARGLYVPRCVANIPSVTLANETSMVTGRFPGHHGITGINWFDRNECIWRNYDSIAQKNTLDGDYQAETIYEKLDDEITVSIFYQAHRGATKFAENWTSAGPPFFFGWYKFVDRISLCRFEIVGQIARRHGRFPRYTIAYMLAADMEAYRAGIESEAYRQALIHADSHIGRVVKDFEDQGLLEKLVLIFASDHGMMPVSRHFRLDEFLAKDLGLNLSSKRLWEQTARPQRVSYYQKFAAVLTGSGDRYFALSLRQPVLVPDGRDEPSFEDWQHRPAPEDLRNYPARLGPVDLVSELIARPAVDAVAFAAGPDAVRIVRKQGEVEFCKGLSNSKSCSYHLISGSDPLGYVNKVPDEMLDGAEYSSRAWLEATAGTDFPDLPPQILAYFRSHLAGDLVVFAAPDWDLSDQWKAGHGGLRPAEMTFPLILAGPGIDHGQLPVTRAVDVVPTILDLLGRTPDEELDGQSLIRLTSPDIRNNHVQETNTETESSEKASLHR